MSAEARNGLPVPLLAAVETAFNRYLALDLENAANLCRPGQGHRDRVAGVWRRLFLLPQTDSVMVLGDYEGDADATISGSPLALMAMHHPGNRSRSLFSGEVEIRGDAGIGQALQRILDDMDIDWEEMLSRYTGDVVAHQLGNLVRGANGWPAAAPACSSRMSASTCRRRRVRCRRAWRCVISWTMSMPRAAMSTVWKPGSSAWKPV